jgi:hypothetical protein
MKRRTSSLVVVLLQRARGLVGDGDLGNDELVLRLARRVRAQQQAVERIVRIGRSRQATVQKIGDRVTKRTRRERRRKGTNVSTSGNHWHVRDGQVSACVRTWSYRNGVFFFQILYS